jgi:hypothetical protein
MGASRIGNRIPNASANSSARLRGEGSRASAHMRGPAGACEGQDFTALQRLTCVSQKIHDYGRLPHTNRCAGDHIFFRRNLF